MSGFNSLEDVDGVISQLTLDEKINLLAGQGRCRTTGVERLNIPALDTSDGPHGLRGYRFYNPEPGCLLSCGTAMGATFDLDLMKGVGNILAQEALCRRVSIALAPVVCLQRSPQLGRGFEAFGEDPVLSGLMGAAYVNGLQEQGIASCIKHYCAHDQTYMSLHDNSVMSERTLREAHLLPFQLAVKHANPWIFMTSYNKINGLHVSENPKLIQDILRGEWGWDGMVLSDWWGTYSTTESINAGMDLEMPGPTQWRGSLLKIAVESRKVNIPTIDTAVRNVLNLVKKVTPALAQSCYEPRRNDTSGSRAFVRKLAAESIVLLKNDDSILPLDSNADKTYGLIGDHFKNAAFCGGGSSEVEPYYKVQPYDALVEVLGETKLSFAFGCNSQNWTPLLWDDLTITGSDEAGIKIDFFEENPTALNGDIIYETTTKKSSVVFADSLPQPFANSYYARLRTTFTAPKTMKWRFGLSVAGKATLSLGGKVIIDQWNSHPEKKKTDISPCFNGFTMERFVDLDVEAGEKLDLEILLTNEGMGPVAGVAPSAGARLGGCEVVDEDQTIADAVALARSVDVPIVMTGLSSDWETENADRSTLELPGRVNELIQRVLDANPSTIVVTQSGMPIEMPWAHKAKTLAHAWLGGQELGHGLTDFLFGHINPSARMPLTFPKRMQDNPAYLTFGKADRDLLYGEGVFIGYKYYEQLEVEPEFYFGHGLSYTQFRYSNLVVPSEFASDTEHSMELLVDLENTGKLRGAEIIQVYITDPDSTFQRPKKELKAFKKVVLEPGEKQKISVVLDKYAVSYWSEEHGRWMAEAGKFGVVLAKSANPRDEILRGEFNLPDTFWWSGL
ncbi:glycoside hydrolase superfamily [Dactylonectria macrodidyma]|uniref:beta-glucosidase n=1 Tax=Dactylonectria macrodidyma TaxID=307937 RepID=A0A9P9FG68_9HYPO|nr:glycoside hydrolase superfamily [Dactylonectria macrodidyma]